jgi:hypothetical protein
LTIVWKISKEDVSHVNAIVARQKNNTIVLARVKRNLAGHERARVERTVLASTGELPAYNAAAVGSRQCSDALQPRKAVCVGLFRMRRRTRSPRVRGANHLGVWRYPPLTDVGYPDRRHFRLLEGGLWPQVHHEIARLTGGKAVARTTEVEVANFINERLAGFGPKQARNLLQGLGLTRYEIPIDSRISKWLKGFGFPAPLSPAALSDRRYYYFISTAVVELWERSGVFPCALDAAVFTSFDESDDPAQS